MTDAGERVVARDDLSTGFAQWLWGRGRRWWRGRRRTGLVQRILGRHGISRVVRLAAKTRSPNRWNSRSGTARRTCTASRFCSRRWSRARRFVIPSSAVDGVAGCRPDHHAERHGADQSLRREEARGQMAGACGREGPFGGHRCVLHHPDVLRPDHRGEAPLIFGADCPAPDGTCIRASIHAADLAEAHLAAVRRLSTSARPGDLTVNVGREGRFGTGVRRPGGERDRSPRPAGDRAAAARGRGEGRSPRWI